MKKIYLVFPLIGLFLNSCLDLSPISEIGEDNFFKNDSEVLSGVNACYNGLHAPLEYEWMLTDLRTDISRVKSKSSQTSISKDLMALDESKASASLVEIEEYWNATYNNIYRCNTVLKNINNVKDETKHKQYEGEALFIRAYHYFNLVRLFGPVFKITNTISADEARKLGRNSIDEIYTLIKDDLNKIVNENLLPESYEKSDLGRATIWSAKTLLAKVYLTLKDYDNAKTLLESVLGSNHKLLTSSYEDVFSTSNEMNEEIIFAVRYKSGNVGLGNPFGNKFAPLNSGTNVITGNGEGLNYPTSKLMNMYETGDSRKSATVEDSYLNKTTNTITEDYYVTKYLSPVTTVYDGEKDIPILRFSDVLLMLAEIENEQKGPTTTAFNYLNQVRNRANLSSLDITDVANKVEFRLTLENERMLEFAYENQRFFDLVRTGRYIDVMNEHYKTELEQFSSNKYYEDGSQSIVKDVEEWQLLLPIPTAEIDVNPSISQNPGY